MKLIWTVNVVALFAAYGAADFLDNYCGNVLSQTVMDRLRARPKWVNGVDNKFKKAQNINQIPGPATGYDLCHVVSWKNIRDSFLTTGKTGCKTCFLERIAKNPQVFQALERFLVALFTPDPLAIAPKIEQDPTTKKWTRLTYIEHEQDILRKIDGSGKSLEALNGEMFVAVRNYLQPTSQDYIFKKTDRYAACADLKVLLEILNSAPANLRYGVTNVNQYLIKEYTDPMGNANGIATTKERQWLAEFPCCYHGNSYAECRTPPRQTCWSSTANILNNNSVRP